MGLVGWWCECECVVYVLLCVCVCVYAEKISKLGELLLEMIFHHPPL